MDEPKLKEVEIENWCHFCLRIGYSDIKQFEKTKYSLCGYCRKRLEEVNLSKTKPSAEGLTKNTIKKVCNSIIDNDNKELYAKTQEELESYWFFKFNKIESDSNNVYEFTKMIELYKNYCRRWEEHHNGSICVVERVRDKYLMPKIKKFIDSFRKMEK